MKTIAQAIASQLDAMNRCRESGNQEWATKWEESLFRIARNLPSGSGIDEGTKIDLDASTPEKIVLIVNFHHMDTNGFYSGWTGHKITVKASLQFGIELKISGRNRDGIKEYLGETYSYTLEQEYKEDAK